MTNHTAYLVTSIDMAEDIELKQGDTIKDFRGEDWRFKRVTRGPQPGRSAKVEVTDMAEFATREFYAEVFPGLEVI